MNEQEVLQVLGSVGAVIVGSHIVYTSGKHGTAYINKDAVYPHTAKTSRLCRSIAERFANDNVQVVIAPAIGGVKLSDRVAEHMSHLTGREVLSIYAEKETLAIPDPEGRERKCFAETGEFVIKRGYDKLITHKNILVVEDVLTTGGSAKKVIEAARSLGGNVVGLGVLVNRGGITPQDVADVLKLDALVSITLDAWDEATCPLCERNVPVNTDVGKGHEFLARRN